MPRVARIRPDGEERERLSCLDCGHVFYENPKIVVGALVVHGDRVLLCRRAIEPRRGFWTLPAGYLELDETTAEGAIRETAEEAGAAIVLDGTLAVFDVARISQVQVIFRARFADPANPVFRPGIESLEVELFDWHGIPWDELAFPTVRWALDAWRAAGSGPLTAPAGNPSHDPRGTGTLPGDHAAFADPSALPFDPDPAPALPDASARPLFRRLS